MGVITIRQAFESDKNDVDDFLQNNFLKSNPLIDAYSGGSIESSAIDFGVSFQKEDVLIATDEATMKIVGTLIAELNDDTSLSKMKSLTQELGECMDADILNFLIYAETKADIFKRFNIKESYQIQTVSVHPDYRGQGIARKLFEACFELTEQKKIKTISVDCVNIYTAKIAEKLGMELTSTVNYDDYNNYVGKQKFVPIHPHLEIRSFAKLL
jgi:ribosomal protein S18 acetylase RimI-like enzyme